MCGIFGYVGTESALGILLKGLSALEYRGYDSAGVCLYNQDALVVYKKQGKVENLTKILENNDNKSKIGIGHTRWATHGAPSYLNSHPHISNNGKIAIVHNGIIENYIELRELLISKGYNFVSDTDSEVIANLIEYYYSDNMLDSISKVMEVMEGSFAIAVMNQDSKNEIICFKRNNPIIIGVKGNNYYLSSDIYPIVEYTNTAFYLEDNEISVINGNEINFYNNELQRVEKRLIDITFSNEDNHKDEYDSFMLKEIHQQPRIVFNLINKYINKKKEIDGFDIIFSKDFLRKINKIYVVACGTSYYAGLCAGELLQRYSDLAISYEVSSEFYLKNLKLDDKTLVIALSQSGETADTLAAVKHAKSKGAKIFSIVNTPLSSLERISNLVAHTEAGKEVSVASTKAFSSQYIVTALFMIYLLNVRKKIDSKEYSNFVESVLKLPTQMIKMLDNKKQIFCVAKQIYNSTNMLYIGRGKDYLVAQEGSLKMKEVSYIHSEAMFAGELKHGPIALIEDNFPVICLLTDSDLVKKTVSNLKEVKARGACVICLTTEDIHKAGQAVDSVIPLAKNEYLQSVLSNIPMQLLAYKVAFLRGNDIDKPRNLAKSVTVE